MFGAVDTQVMRDRGYPHSTAILFIFKKLGLKQGYYNKFSAMVYMDDFARC